MTKAQTTLPGLEDSQQPAADAQAPSAKRDDMRPALDAIRALRGRIDALDSQIEGLQRTREETQAQPRTLVEVRTRIRKAWADYLETLEGTFFREHYSPESPGGFVQGGKGRLWLEACQKPQAPAPSVRELFTKQLPGGGSSVDPDAFLALCGDAAIERLCQRAETMFADHAGITSEERGKRLEALDVEISELDLERETLLTELERFGLAVTEAVTR